MTFRSDITVDWSVSPRIITVASPSVELLIQDLIDTLRDLEDDIVNMGYKAIVRATGKQSLTSDLLVGITCTLLNARLAFGDRAGPSFIRCDIKGGNLLAVDSDDLFVEVIEVTDFTQIVYDLSPTPTQVVGVGGDGGTRAYGIIQG